MMRLRIFTAFPMEPKTLTSAVPDMLLVPFASHPVRERQMDLLAHVVHRCGIMRRSASRKGQIESVERMFMEVFSSP
jgi:hypothetical protein